MTKPTWTQPQLLDVPYALLRAELSIDYNGPAGVVSQTGWRLLADDDVEVELGCRTLSTQLHPPRLTMARLVHDLAALHTLSLKHLGPF